MTTTANYDEQWPLLDDMIAFNPGARHRRRIVRNILGPLRFSTLLDVGCGNGALIRELVKAAGAPFTATGVDFAESVIGRNRARQPNVEFRTLDIEREALDRRFEMVVCSEVIEHLSDRRHAMRHLASMVECGGHLVVTCPTGRLYETERYFGHVSHPTLDELVALGREQGLSIVSAANWGWPTYKLLKFATNANTPWVLKEFAGGPYSAGKRALCHLLYWANFLNLSDWTRGCQLFVLFRKP